MPARKKKKTEEAPPVEAKPKKAPNSGWDLFASGKAIIDNANALATDLKHRKKNRHGAFATMNQVQSTMMPAPSFMEQYLWNAFGWRHRTVFELIAAEGVGKTSQVMQMLAQAMIHDQAPCLYSTGDQKVMSSMRVRRIMHRDPTIAQQMVDMITIHKPHALHEMVENMEVWVKTMRGKVSGPGVDKRKMDAVPDHIPLVVALEHPGKLLSRAEAMGYYNFADYMNAANMKNLKQINEGSNLEHSKFAAGFFRHMQAFMDVNNVFLIWTSHQNEKIDMSGYAQTYLSETQKALTNKTKNMGKAVDQNAAYQLILAKAGLVKNAADEIIGMKVKARVQKNSYGPPNRVIEYELHDVHTTDTDTYQEPVFYYHNAFANLLAEKQIMGVTLSAERYTCRDLGLIGLSAQDFEAGFMANQAAVNRLGSLLQIDGYDITVDSIKAALVPPTAPPIESYETTDETENPEGGE